MRRHQTHKWVLSACAWRVVDKDSLGGLHLLELLVELDQGVLHLAVLLGELLPRGTRGGMVGLQASQRGGGRRQPMAPAPPDESKPASAATRRPRLRLCRPSVHVLLLSLHLQLVHDRPEQCVLRLELSPLLLLAVGGCRRRPPRRRRCRTHARLAIVARRPQRGVVERHRRHGRRGRSHQLVACRRLALGVGTQGSPPAAEWSAASNG